MRDNPYSKTKSNKKPCIDIADDDFTCILTTAIRYSLGREAYMPSLVTGYIRPLLPLSYRQSIVFI